MKPIYAHTAPGSNYPEYLSINDVNGEIKVTVRSPATGNECGAGATMTLPRDQIPALVERLLSLPPVSEVAESKPLVLYFKTEEDRKEMIAAVSQALPNARAVAL